MKLRQQLFLTFFVHIRPTIVSLFWSVSIGSFFVRISRYWVKYLWVRVKLFGTQYRFRLVSHSEDCYMSSRADKKHKRVRKTVKKLHRVWRPMSCTFDSAQTCECMFGRRERLNELRERKAESAAYAGTLLVTEVRSPTHCTSLIVYNVCRSFGKIFALLALMISRSTTRLLRSSNILPFCVCYNCCYKKKTSFTNFPFDFLTKIAIGAESTWSRNAAQRRAEAFDFLICRSPFFFFFVILEDLIHEHNEIPSTIWLGCFFFFFFFFFFFYKHKNRR